MSRSFATFAFACSLFLTAGCGSFNAVPWPTSSYTLDSEAIEFIRSAPRPSLARYAEQHLRQAQDYPERAVMIASSGGGARAAAFTLGVLAELEHLGEWTSTSTSADGLREVDYFSTVSGGGWGVAAYLTDRYFSEDPTNYRLNRPGGMEGIVGAFLDFGPKEECLSQRIDSITSREGQALRLGDVFVRAGDGAPQLPYLFVNATVAGNQAPFLFTDDFLQHYRVRSMTFCDEPVEFGTTPAVDDVLVGQAVATSGSVPGFYQTPVKTGVCEDPALEGSFFCNYGYADFDEMTLVDGGIYDNYGYLNALDIIASDESAETRTLIVIDSNADTDIPFVRDGEPGLFKTLTRTGIKTGFPARTSAFRRTFDRTADAFGIETVLLDFAVASGLSSTDTSATSGRSVLDGLGRLRRYADTEVICFSDQGRQLRPDGLLRQGETDLDIRDCLANNFYRTGLIGKTTYKPDEDSFPLLVELGRLVVRLRADELYRAIFGTTAGELSN